MTKVNEHGKEIIVSPGKSLEGCHQDCRGTGAAMGSIELWPRGGGVWTRSFSLMTGSGTSEYYYRENNNGAGGRG